MSAPPPGQWPPPSPDPSDRPPLRPAQPPWPPQLPFVQQPPGPQTSAHHRAKWIVLGGLALLTVIVVTVVTTLLLTRTDSDTPSAPVASPTPSTSADTSDIASASDDGPIGIITEDPTCAAWAPIGDTFASIALRGWDDRDPSIPASAWTSQQRVQHEVIADAMRSAADQTVALVSKTPHRVMRELYEQSIAYWRMYAQKVPDYVPTDDHLARVAVASSNSLAWICSAITYGSAQSRAPLTVDAPAPLQIEPPGDPSAPTPYVTRPLAVCPQWAELVNAFDIKTSDWLTTDPNLPVSEWTPRQQTIWAEVSTVMSSNANAIQDLGMRSENSVFDDFATLAAQYRRAFVQSFPTYVPADGHLANAAAQLVATNDQACKAAGTS